MDLRQIVKDFRHSTYVRDASTLTLGTAAAQLLGLIAMPLLARQYEPIAFGVLAIFMAVGSIVATAVTFRYETAIILPSSEAESLSLVTLSLVLALGLGALVCITSAILPGGIRAVVGVSMLGAWLPVAVLFGVSTAIIATGTVWFNRARSYLGMAYLRVAQSASYVILAVFLGTWGFADGLVIAQVVASILVAIAVIWWLPRVVWRVRADSLLRLAERHHAAPKYVLPAALLDVITLQLPVLLITIWFGATEAGQFSMAWRVLAVPVTLLGGAVGQVFLQRFAHAWPNAEAAKKLLVRTWVLLACVGIFPICMLMAFGDRIFTLILGPTWEPAGQFAVVMAPMLFFMLVSSPTSGACMVLGLQKLGLFFGAAFLTYRTLAIYIGYKYENLTLGLILWVLFELVAILIYNLAIVRRLDRK